MRGDLPAVDHGHIEHLSLAGAELLTRVGAAEALQAEALGEGDPAHDSPRIAAPSCR